MSQLKNIKRLHDFGLLHDLSFLTTTKTEVKAHALICAACSPLVKQEVTKGNRQIYLPAVDENVLKEILDYFYTGRITLSIDNILLISRLAKHLKLEVLYEICLKLIQVNLNANNWNDYDQFSVDYCMDELRKLCDLFMLRHFEELIISDNFLKLPLERLVKLLKDDELLVANEDIVLSAVLTWLNANLGININDVYHLKNNETPEGSNCVILGAIESTDTDSASELASSVSSEKHISHHKLSLEKLFDTEDCETYPLNNAEKILEGTTEVNTEDDGDRLSMFVENGIEEKEQNASYGQDINTTESSNGAIIPHASLLPSIMSAPKQTSSNTIKRIINNAKIRTDLDIADTLIHTYISDEDIIDQLLHCVRFEHCSADYLLDLIQEKNTFLDKNLLEKLHRKVNIKILYSLSRSENNCQTVNDTRSLVLKVSKS